ncbi:MULTISPECIES: hypothetical protein [Larkinella]|jgi:uncharacterized protein (UPF0332 family)|uniref:HEPN domain-containing protein n=1 Tax=Larkinella humicola TaxID=2607654 RepID=A0A5N1JQI8_9BACT|nr:MULTISPECIES: hypothetical protein [Larkinella]KAA9356879.1 hypothetical protein F0P93_03825 [Larkinella humicola]
MSKLLQKSNDSIQACQLLIEQHNLYTSSIHHAYYSSFQRSIYLLQIHFPKSLIEKTEEASSHVHVITTVEQKLVDSGYRFQALDFNQHINTLKRNRVHADYKNDLFDEKFSLKSLELARKLNIIIDELTNKLSSITST